MGLCDSLCLWGALPSGQDLGLLTYRGGVLVGEPEPSHSRWNFRSWSQGHWIVTLSTPLEKQSAFWWAFPALAYAREWGVVTKLPISQSFSCQYSCSPWSSHQGYCTTHWGSITSPLTTGSWSYTQLRFHPPCDPYEVCISNVVICQALPNHSNSSSTRGIG